MPILEDDFIKVLEQRKLLKEYCRQFRQIGKESHRAYWELIKRVHAKLDKRERERQQIEERLREAELRKKQEQEAIEREIERQRKESLKRYTLDVARINREIKRQSQITRLDVGQDSDDGGGNKSIGSKTSTESFDSEGI